MERADQGGDGMKFQVTCEILETHKQVVEAPDAARAEDDFRY